jgi:hypothetical protein
MEPKNEMEVLLSEVEIGPYKIKPWPFGKFKKVLPAVVDLLRPLKDMGLTFENAEEFFMGHGLEVIMLLPDGIEAISTMVGVTLDMENEEVDKIDTDLIPLIAVAIVSQNLSRLKNSLPLIMAHLKAMTRGA